MATGFPGAERGEGTHGEWGKWLLFWGALHWSCVSLGFGLQEEMGIGHGSRAAATITKRIVENGSTPLLTQILDVRWGWDLDVLGPIFFPWKEENISETI